MIESESGAQHSEVEGEKKVYVVPTYVPLARFVVIPLAAKAIGYSESAIHKKIDDGTWRRGREWQKAPDGRRLIDLKAVEDWITGVRQK